MKKYEFDISETYIKKFFFPVRDKIGLLKVLIESVNYMFLNPKIKEDKKKGKIILQVDKMSRLFFFTEDKFFSIVFPFFVTEKDDILMFSFKNKVEITYEILSNIQSCLINEVFDSNELDNEYDNNFWEIYQSLLIMEDGYIRYDHDPINFSIFRDKGEPNKHPLHHYDLFYSSTTTFKIGIKSAIKEKDFINFSDITKDCNYIN